VGDRWEYHKRIRGTGKEYEIRDVMYRPRAKGRVGKSGVSTLERRKEIGRGMEVLSMFQMGWCRQVRVHPLPGHPRGSVTPQGSMRMANQRARTRKAGQGGRGERGL